MATQLEAALERLISGINLELADTETSVEGELVFIGPYRGTELLEAIQSVEACFVQKRLPHEIRQTWRRLLLLTDEERPEKPSKQQCIDACDWLTHILVWARSRLNAAQSERDDTQPVAGGHAARPMDAMQTDSGMSEPLDIYAARVAAHQLIDAVFEAIDYVQIAVKLYDNEGFAIAIYLPDKERMEWSQSIGFCVEGEKDPREKLAQLILKYDSAVRAIMETHGKFNGALKPLTDEIAGLYDGSAIEFLNVTCRSHCACLDSLAQRIVSGTFKAVNDHTAAEEWDEAIKPGEGQHGIMPSSFPHVLAAVAHDVNGIDVPDTVHEIIELEFENLWAGRHAPDYVPTRADADKKSGLRMPDSVNVLDLCKLLAKNRSKIEAGEKSEASVAREFFKDSKDVDRKAKNLLRQARRYPHLWK